MTHRVTISAPDDVADRIATLPSRQDSADVGAGNSATVRGRRAAEQIRATLVAAGHREFPYEPEAAAKRLRERSIDSETRLRAITRLAETTGRPVAQVLAAFDRRAKG